MSKRQDHYTYRLWIPWSKNTRILTRLRMPPRHAQYMHKAWKRHQNTVYWVDINLAIQKGLTFYQARSNAIILLGGQTTSSFMPSVVKTEVPLDCDDLARKDFLFQQKRERIEKLTEQTRLSRFCMDAGFLNVVEIGQ